MKTDDILIVSPALQAKVEAAAAEEHRPAAELLRDFIERGLSERRPQALSAYGHARTPAEAGARIRELRKGNILPKGVTIRDLINYGRA